MFYSSLPLSLVYEYARKNWISEITNRVTFFYIFILQRFRLYITSFYTSRGLREIHSSSVFWNSDCHNTV